MLIGLPHSRRGGEHFVCRRDDFGVQLIATLRLDQFRDFLNDVDAWRDRVAAGEAQLLQHTLEGLNAMPPLGYCMDCTEADFRALIRFMIPAELKTTETDT